MGRTASRAASGGKQGNSSTGGSSAERRSRTPAPLSPGTKVGRSTRRAGAKGAASVAWQDRDDVEVRRSARRRRTVQAYRSGGKTIVLIPAGLAADEEDRWVDMMVARLDKGAARRRPGDEELQQRALELSDRFFAGVADMPVPVSVSWSDRQQRRWGSCTPDEGTIRLSRRLSGMPTWVLDYVLVHELAHLLVPDHSPRFWEHVERYPLAERAKGFLMGVASVDEAVPQAEG
jgi:predicted metal-dependent hydrolase